MPTQFDDHGQPTNLRFNAARRVDRTIHEMLGLVKGLIVDGEVTEGEAQFLDHWIRANPEAVSTWPGDALATRLRRVFGDGAVSAEEREDLLYFLQEMAGPDHGQYGHLNVATRLPLDEPPEVIIFQGREFVFTGRFIWGTRTACENAVLERGGAVGKGITRRTRVLVLGELGSRDWAHTSFGRKIEKAVQYKRDGIPIQIVDEQHWSSHL